MKIKYINATGAARKEMVRVIEGVTGQKARYLGMPTAAYQIDFLTVEKDGTLAASGIYVTEREVLDKVLQALKDAGFEWEKPAYDDSARLGGMYQRNEQTGQLVKLVSDDQCALSVHLPRDKANVQNLIRLLRQKEALIRKALGTVTASFGMNEDEIWFPWWHTMPTPEETQAYIDFI
ncbi:MAG: virulence protein, partial [Oscillospiraceae bacterium]|nr:virulence protein [Oscillospiraceae bacterium]